MARFVSMTRRWASIARRRVLWFMSRRRHQDRGGRRDRVDGEAEIHHATRGASSCILTSQVAALLEAHVRLGGRAEQDPSTHVFPAGSQRRRPIPTGQRRTSEPSMATHLVSSRNYPAAELDRPQTHDDLGEAGGAGRSRPRETACVRAASAGRLSCRWWKRPSGSMRARATDGPEPSRSPRRRLVGDCEIVSSRLGVGVRCAATSREVIDLRPSSPQNRATKECRRVLISGEDGDAFGCFYRAVWWDKLFARNILVTVGAEISVQNPIVQSFSAQTSSRLGESRHSAPGTYSVQLQAAKISRSCALAALGSVAVAAALTCATRFELHWRLHICATKML